MMIEIQRNKEVVCFVVLYSRKDGRDGQYFDPTIIMNPITHMSYVFYAVYAVFLLLPMGLQIVGEWRFEKLRTTADF